MEVFIGIVFVIFVIAKTIFGKDDGSDPGDAHYPPGRRGPM